MKCLSLRFILLVCVSFIGANLYSQTSNKNNIIYTTLDLKQDYEVVDMVFGYSTIFDSKEISKENIEDGWNDLKAKARPMDIDAVIGIRIEITPPYMTEEHKSWIGLVTVYGTAVKFKKNE